MGVKSTKFLVTSSQYCFYAVSMLVRYTESSLCVEVLWCNG